MLDRTRRIDEINFALSLLSTVVAFNSKQGLFDIHKTLEDVFIGILGIAYDVSLTNLNIEKHNHPAIDLGDASKGVAYQITSDGSKDKIQTTEEKMKEYGLYNTYPELYVVILSEQTRTKYRGENGTIKVLNLADIAGDIGNLDSHKLFEMYEFFEREFSSYLPGKNESILKPTQRPSSDPQKTIPDFLAANGIDPSSPHEDLTEGMIRDGLVSLKEKLSFLSNDQRFFIFHVMNCALQQRNYHKFNDCVAPVTYVQAKCSRHDSALQNTYESLKAENLAELDEYSPIYGERPAFSVFYYIKEVEDVNFIQTVACYLHLSEQTDKLESVIVDCDFSIIH